MAFTLFSLPAFSQATIQQLLNNGSTDKRINIVFLSEGYTSSELSKYIGSDVHVMLNKFTGTFPFIEYATYFNAFAISVASAESGSDHPSLGIYRNTFFNSTYETAGITRLLTLQGEGYWRADSLLQLLMPEYDIVVVIVNDIQYGGSGGSIAVTSINSAAPEIVMHELGHSFGHLADEYEDITPGYSGNERPNTTAETRRNFIKWKSWIDNSTPIPTPELNTYSSVVGLFEGASYEPFGWFRPKLNCKMRTLGTSYCDVCSEYLVESAYGLISPIESFTPSSPTLTIVDPDSASMSVVPLMPQGHALEIQWTSGGIAIASETLATFNAHAQMLGNGTHVVAAVVWDPTSTVRNDPYQLLRDSVSWVVNVSGVTFSPPDLASPQSGALSQPVTLTVRWHPASNATSYRLQVASDIRFFNVVEDYTSLTDTFKVIGPLPNGEYYWRVIAYNTVSEPSAPSSSWNFTTVLGIPVLIDPENGSIGQANSISLYWKRTSGATSYHLQLSKDSNFVMLTVDNSTITDTSYLVGPLEYSTTYHWRVSAQNPGDSSFYSAMNSFTTSIAPPPAPILVSPLDGEYDQPIIMWFYWDSSNTASSYRLQVALDSLFSMVVNDQTTTDIYLAVGPLGNLTEYYWRVAAVNAGGQSGYSSVRRFTTIVETPTLDSPPNGAVNRELTLRLGWGSINGAISYRLQLSRDSLFTDLVLDDSTITRLTRYVGQLELATIYYWRVKATRETGFTPFSLPWHFTTRATIDISLAISAGWNIISIPMTMADLRKDVLFPTAMSAAFEYEAYYRITDTLRYGKGYWLNFNKNQMIPFTGYPISEDSINILEGWNLIGSISSPVATTMISSIPPSIVTSQFYGYSGVYFVADSIYPGYGYWVKSNQDGKLVLSPLNSTLTTSRIKIDPKIIDPPQPPTRAEDRISMIPAQFAIELNYPNPFNPITIIRYSLKKDIHVSLRVYDVLGRDVKTLVNEFQPAGYKSVQFDASSLPSGVYFYRLTAGTFTDINKMLLAK